MKKLTLASLVLAAALTASVAGAHQTATVNGKTPKGVKVTKVKAPKGTTTVTTKKHRKKFLGIF